MTKGHGVSCLAKVPVCVGSLSIAGDSTRTGDLCLFMQPRTAGGDGWGPLMRRFTRGEGTGGGEYTERVLYSNYSIEDRII